MPDRYERDIELELTIKELQLARAKNMLLALGVCQDVITNFLENIDETSILVPEHCPMCSGTLLTADLLRCEECKTIII